MGTIAFYEAVLRVSPSAILVVDQNLNIRVVNFAAEKLLGLAAEKLVGRHIGDCALIGQPGLVALENTLKEGQEQTIAGDSAREGREQTRVVFQASRLADHDGRTLGAVLILEPAGLQQEAEKILNNEKLELIEQMSIGIAHHVRNSLTAVRGFIQIMKERSGGEPVTGFTEFSSIALKELDRVNDVISNLLYLANVSESKKESVNIISLLENVYAFIRGKAAMSGIFVVKEFSPVLPNPCADVVQIIHALFNILDNAVRSMPDGGRLLLRACEIPGENRICIEISDTGVGISPENIKHIFNPFFTTREDGTGFGLALANKIVHDHGGEIRVSSEEGKGSTFFVYLPFKALAEQLAE